MKAAWGRFIPIEHPLRPWLAEQRRPHVARAMRREARKVAWCGVVKIGPLKEAADDWSDGEVGPLAGGGRVLRQGHLGREHGGLPGGRRQDPHDIEGALRREVDAEGSRDDRRRPEISELGGEPVRVQVSREVELRMVAEEEIRKRLPKRMCIKQCDLQKHGFTER